MRRRTMTETMTERKTVSMGGASPDATIAAGSDRPIWSCRRRERSDSRRSRPFSPAPTRMPRTTSSRPCCNTTGAMISTTARTSGSTRSSHRSSGASSSRWCPRTDLDGNEIGGVPVVLLQAPLGTYLGWNVTATGFHKGKVCNYQGGWIPFAKTRAERLVSGDPRLSLEERYGTHANYFTTVRAAAARIVAQGFLLQADADALIAAAKASNVLNP